MRKSTSFLFALIVVGGPCALIHTIVWSRPIDSQAPASAPTTTDAAQDDRRHRLLELWSHSNIRGNTLTPLHRVQTGLIVPVDQLPENSGLGATIISIHDSGDVHAMLEQIAQQAQIRIGAEHPGIFHGDAQVHLDLDHVPMLEAVNQLCSQAGLKITGTEMALSNQPGDPRSLPRLLLGQNFSNRGLGIWSISGPISYEVTQIEHHVPINPNTFDVDGVTVSIQTHYEPRLRLFSGPGVYSLDEAVDENGNSLLMPPDGPRPPAPFNGTAIFLAYPAEHPGHRIARLRARDHCIIVKKIERVELSIPQSGSPATQAVGGMFIDAEVDDQNSGNNAIYSFKFTLRRGERSAFDWANLSKAGGGMAPKLETTDGNTIDPLSQPGVKTDADSITIAPQWWRRSGNRVERPLRRIIVEVPVDVRGVDIPIAFDNLPLP